MKIFKLLMLNFLMLSMFNFAHPVTPTMLKIKESPDFLFGLLFTMMSLGTFLSSPFWGNNLDRLGTKKIMVISPIMYAFFQMLFGYSFNTIIMLSARFFSGIFAAAWIVGVNSSINYYSTNNSKAKNFAYVMVSTSLGGIVGQLTSGQIGIIWYHSFIVQVCGLLILSFLNLFLLENIKVKTKNLQKLTFKKIKSIVFKEQILFILLAMSMVAIISTTLVSSLNEYANDYLNFTSTQLSFISSFAAFSSLTANLLFIPLFDRYFNFFKTFYIKLSIAFVGFLALFSIIFLTFIHKLDYSFIVSIILFSSIFLIFSMVNIYRPITQKFLLNNKNLPSGELLGIINSANALGMMGGGLSLSLTYGISEILPFIMIWIYLILAFVFIFIAKKQFQSTK